MMYDMRTVAEAESIGEVQQAGFAVPSNRPLTRNADTGSVSSTPTPNHSKPLSCR